MIMLWWYRVVQLVALAVREACTSGKRTCRGTTFSCPSRSCPPSDLKTPPRRCGAALLGGGGCAALRSFAPLPACQVGACIANADNRVVAIGYNGFPRGCSDDMLPWAREAPPGGDALDTKYPYVVHAEANAILNCSTTASLKGARMYVALFPCNECAKLILQTGIAEVVYLCDKYHDTCVPQPGGGCACTMRPTRCPPLPLRSTPMIASRRMLDMAGVRYRQHTPRDASITLTFKV